MKLLEDLITNRPLHVIGEDATVLDAVNVMDRFNVGALPILRDNHVVGVVSERDVARRVVLKGLDPVKTKLSEIMTRDIVVGMLEDGFEKCVEKMRSAKVRHLPVIKEHRLIGFISMRDLFKHEIQVQAEELKHLNEYIHFTPPSG